MLDNNGNIKAGPLFVTAIIVFLVTMGTMFLWQEYQKFTGAQSVPYVQGQPVPQPMAPQPVVPQPQVSVVEFPTNPPAPTIDSMATYNANATAGVETAQAQMEEYNRTHPTAAPPQAQNIVVPTPGPNLIPYSACRDTRAYSTTNDGDQYYIGFIPKDQTVFIEAQSSDGKWVKFHAPDAATEWWTPISNICVQ